ncbi:hypothetical protein RN001_005478 [Aquatica leii]|uniref:SAP domain-containing protein n=1 Tax=Aquatica leii TaxID=1421715 RepID=A0AAN7PCH0_9COLE|nr:hypothetical protein RN001_005478 [Aquatica leii]
MDTSGIQASVVLEPKDVPGAVLHHDKIVEDCSILELKRWLECRGLKQQGNKSELVQRVINCINAGRENDIFLGVDGEEKLAKPGTSHEIQEISQLTEVQSNKLETPIKQIENGNTQYPTPFKSALFWPNRTERVKRKITDSSKSKLPKLQPTVAISDDFMEYQRRLEEEKQKKEEEKKRRTEERKKKIDEKQKIQEEKKKKSEKKLRKRADIQGKHEERDQEQREENTTRNIEENSNKDKHEPDNKTDQELNQNVAENKENVEYIPNTYVIVNYDGQLYPSKILEVSEESVKVRAIAGCGCLLKRPEKEDILDYVYSDICKINPPF